MDGPDAPIPVNIITGFLGSGKTTLLQRLLASPRLSNTAVLINEFGEVGLDHLLLRRIDGETMVLESGCVCCTIRDDLGAAVRDLYSKRTRGDVPAFDRIVIETTGLADPAPIIFTMMADPVLKYHVRLGNVVTTVDAVNAPLHLAANPESVKQVAVADRLVLTKTDLCDQADVAAVRAALRDINPAAALYDTSQTFDPVELIASDLHDPDRKAAEVAHWLEHEGAPTNASRHDHDIYSFCLTFDEPLDWTAFGLWLSMLLHAHGERVLRVKGLLNVADLAAPVVIHGVQHLVHPPVHLDAWPSDDRRSRIVFIVRGLERGAIERSLAAFNGMADRPSKAA
jgi:G3E family GTPase